MRKRQSLAGYVREHLGEIEGRLEFGIRQDVILSELEARGHKTTLKGFRNCLYRARLYAADKPPLATSPMTATFPAHPDLAVASKPLQPPPENPLTKSKGFEFVGTSAIDESELI